MLRQIYYFVISREIGSVENTAQHKEDLVTSDRVIRLKVRSTNTVDYTLTGQTVNLNFCPVTLGVSERLGNFLLTFEHEHAVNDGGVFSPSKIVVLAENIPWHSNHVAVELYISIYGDTLVQKIVVTVTIRSTGLFAFSGVNTTATRSSTM